MIGDLVLNVVFWFLNFLLSVFPASSGFPPEVLNSATTIGGYLHLVSPILPVSTLLTVVGIVFSVEIAIFGFKTVRWLVGHIPVIGGNH